MFSSSQFESAPAFTGGGGGFNYSQSTQSADPVPTSAKVHQYIHVSESKILNGNFYSLFQFDWLFLRNFMQSRDTQPMVPVTAKQIIEASQSTDDKSNFLVDGAIVSNVSMNRKSCYLLLMRFESYLLTFFMTDKLIDIF